MEFTESTNSTEDSDAIIVKADEVDEAGADISTISPLDASESEFNTRIEKRRAQDAQPGGSPRLLANDVPLPSQAGNRPTLRREGSKPAPPQQPPPPAPQDEPSNPTDSLSLQQLRRLVTDLPKLQPTAYAYEYSETRSFPEELEEWFSYTEDERNVLLRAKQSFAEVWEQGQAEFPHPSDKVLEWPDGKQVDREDFMGVLIDELDSPDIRARVKSLECISYVALGAWGDTAGVECQDEVLGRTADESQWLASQSSKPQKQLSWIFKGIGMLCSFGAVQKLLSILQKISESEQSIRDVDTTADGPLPENDNSVESRALRYLEVNQTLTCLYVLVEASRWQHDTKEAINIHDAIATFEPNILVVLSRMISNMRWEENPSIPLSRVLLLFWKSVLLLFGGFKDLEESKALLRQDPDVQDNEHDENFLTTSPLDYHLFRQEITSKYPAYSPPPPLVPLEDHNNSILPPLSTHPSRQVSQENLQATVASSASGTSASIFYQPVHIATPAPSPPPSPAGPGGKGGKKQNYQTNQNFPFLYPPLDHSSNTVGGKGNAELQDHLVGRKWEGSDVPASILEAGQLFASRMRMSRSIRQLWDARERYITSERGWNDSFKGNESCFDDQSEPKSANEQETDDEGHEGRRSRSSSIEDDYADDREMDNEVLQKRLAAIKNFYRDTMPDLQSIVMVFWRVLLSNVSAMVTQNNNNGMPNGFPEDGDAAGRKRTNPGSSAHLNGMANGHLTDNENGNDPVIEELNAIRSREITSKAVSGLLLALLKWFKLSHILQYEYLTQLLLDANYLPLILKYFAHQDIDRAVDQRNDRKDLDFFSFCRLNSKHPPTSPARPALSPSSSSEDEAAPPPITKHRRSPTSQSPPPTPPPPVARPEVDELGYPTSGVLPQTPLTDYAPRFFLTNINFLRIIQKITKRKAHRALLLVQYKSSTILRKALKIPQPQLRLYTLKPFKSLVPYCGRKWRQTNMRVITAIYLHCRPELRDEWLCGGDVDGAIEEAVPLEQAGRSLVHWWHLEEFKGAMEGKEGEKLGITMERKEEYNFFARELERMGWGVGGMGVGEEEEGQGGREPVVGSSEFEGGPLAMEGWA